MPISKKEYQEFQRLIVAGLLDDAELKRADALMTEYEVEDAKPTTLERAGIAMTARGPARATEQVQADTKLMGQGALRAPLTLAEGLGDLATDVGTAIATESPRNPLGFMSGEEAKGVRTRYDQAVGEQRKGLDPLELGTSEVVAELPFAVNPGGIVRRGRPFFDRIARRTEGFGAQATGPFKPTTVSGAVASNAAMGGLAGAAHYDPGTDAADQAVRALIVGGSAAVAGALMSVPTAGRNEITRLVDAARTRNPVLVRMANEVEERVPGGFTLSQLTGVPYLRTLEGKAYNSISVNRYADQSRKTVVKYAQDMVEVLNERELGVRISRAKGIAEKELDELETIQKVAWVDGLKEAMSTAGDSRAFISTANINDAVLGLLGGKPTGLGVPSNVKSIASSPNFKADNSPLLRILNDHPGVGAVIQRIAINAGKGKASLEGFGSALQNIEELNRELARLAKAGEIGDQERALITRVLRSATDADAKLVKQMAINSPEHAALGRGIDVLMETRGQYQLHSALIDDMSDDAVRRMFGGGGPVTRGTMFDEFVGMTPSAQRRVMDFMDKHVEDLPIALRNEAVQRAIKQAATHGRLTKAATDAPYDMYTFQKALLEEKITPQNLFTGVQRDQINKTVDALRVVNNFRPEFRVAGTPVVGEDIAPNLMSGSPIFVARQMARIMEGSDNAAKVLLDPEVYRGLLRIASTVGPAQVTARLMLAQYLSSEYPDEQLAGAGQGEP